MTDKFPQEEQCVVSRYVPNPLLINGRKFDLRIYVLVTSVDPLRIYIYKEGLARFASEVYSDVLENNFSHLTNYSLNKKNATGGQVDDSDLKWTLTKLTKKLEAHGVDMDLLWSKIYDIIIKTFISVDHHI